MRYLVLVAPLVLVSAARVDAQEARRPPSITATGSVDIAIPPDRAAVILTIAGEGLDLGSATAAVDSAAARLTTVARRHDLTVMPWGGSYGENMAIRRMMPGQVDVHTTRDYLARSGVLVLVPEVAQTNQVVLDMAKSGITGSIQLVYFVNEGSPQLLAAHSDATALARERADAMARELGGQLGQLVSVTTQPTGFMPPLLQRLQIHDGMNSPLQPSDVLIRVSVNASWEFISR